MKNRTSSNTLLIFILSLIISLPVMSQEKKPAVAAININNIIGKWNCVKVIPVSANAPSANKPKILPPTPEIETDEKQAPAAPDTAKKNVVAQEPGNRPKFDQSKDPGKKKAFMMFGHTTFEFSANKKAVLTSPIRSDNYSWKKSKNNILTVKNQKTKEKTELEIIKLSTDTLKFEQHFPSGNIQIVYSKKQ